MSSGARIAGIEVSTFSIGFGPVLFLISYCILMLLIAGPLLFALVQEIRTTYPILLIGVLYRVIRLTPGFSFRVKK